MSDATDDMSASVKSSLFDGDSESVAASVAEPDIPGQAVMYQDMYPDGAGMAQLVSGGGDELNVGQPVISTEVDSQAVVEGSGDQAHFINSAPTQTAQYVIPQPLGLYGGPPAELLEGDSFTDSAPATSAGVVGVPEELNTEQGTIDNVLDSVPEELNTEAGAIENVPETDIPTDTTLGGTADSTDGLIAYSQLTQPQQHVEEPMEVSQPSPTQEEPETECSVQDVIRDLDTLNQMSAGTALATTMSPAANSQTELLAETSPMTTTESLQQEAQRDEETMDTSEEPPVAQSEQEEVSAPTEIFNNMQASENPEDEVGGVDEVDRVVDAVDAPVEDEPTVPQPIDTVSQDSDTLGTAVQSVTSEESEATQGTVPTTDEPSESPQVEPAQDNQDQVSPPATDSPKSAAQAEADIPSADSSEVNSAPVDTAAPSVTADSGDDTAAVGDTSTLTAESADDASAAVDNTTDTTDSANTSQDQGQSTDQASATDAKEAFPSVDLIKKNSPVVTLTKLPMDVDNISDVSSEKSSHSTKVGDNKTQKADTGKSSKVEVVDVDDDDDDDVTVVGMENASKRNKKTNNAADPKNASATPTTTANTDNNKDSSKTPKCVVCSKVGKCKYNIMRNGDIKHLCEDECFKKFRSEPSSYLNGATAKQCDHCKGPIDTSKQLKLHMRNGSVKFLCRETCVVDFKRSDFCIYCGKPSSFKSIVDEGLKPFCSNDCLGSYNKGKPVGKKKDDDIQIVGSSSAPRGAGTAEAKRSTTSTTTVATPETSRGTERQRTLERIRAAEKQKEQEKQEALDKQRAQERQKKAQEKQKAQERQAGLEVQQMLDSQQQEFKWAGQSSSCVICNKVKPIKYMVSVNRNMQSLCSDKCLVSFKRRNDLDLHPCDNCGALCSTNNRAGGAPTIRFEGKVKNFCGFICFNSFKNKKQQVMPCAWCKTPKMNFDMVERVDDNNKVQLFCTLKCLSLYRVNLQATSNRSFKCDQCGKMAPAQYHLTMSDASVRNFCTYNCVISFQSNFNSQNQASTQNNTDSKRSSVGSGADDASTNLGRTRGQTSASGRATRQSARAAAKDQSQDDTASSDGVPVISDVVSLAAAVNAGPQKSQKTATPKQAATSKQTSTGTITQHIILEPPKPKLLKNKALLCKPYCQTKATSCRPHTQTKETQTTSDLPRKPILVPVPVPIYVPTPMAMYSAPVPYPVPIPVPIPVPCFIPTTKKSSDGILKKIKEIQERIPADPFEAELLMMAEAVANADKSGSDSSDSSDDEDHSAPLPTQATMIKPESSVYQSEGATEGALGEDMLQMALRMASEISEEPVLDLENTLQPNPVQPMDHSQPQFSTIDQTSDVLTATTPRATRSPRRRSRGRPKKARYDEDASYEPNQIKAEATPAAPTPAPIEPKPICDENMVLKYSYGVNAWKHWVAQKNAIIDQTSPTNLRSRKPKYFKTDLLACTADELNFSLCLFVKEVRKPNGDEYACDSIYYLCLGIQQYLYENGRIDNIFTDFYYERFTECLNEVLLNYEVRLNAQGLIVCRIEEEHLWECKQLGAHSPYILLNTLIYFNTKYFHLKSPEEHVKLSFSHIMKHWKRANGQSVSTKLPLQTQGAKSVYLRYYAPSASGGEPGSKRKREEAPVFEQGENTDNPLRCPVKLYEFYLSKCPESIKNRSDVFYLVPERSCVPDSPVWYATGALGVDVMTKFLNRLRVVREIQECYLQSHPMFM